MIIIHYDEETIQNSGIQAAVYPFARMPEFSILVRADGCIDVEGSATLSPDGARTFAAGLIVASMIEEGSHEDTKITIACGTQPSKVRRVWTEDTKESLVCGRSPWRHAL